MRLILLTSLSVTVMIVGVVCDFASIMSGIIAIVTPTLYDIWKYESHHSEGTCAWFGRSLFCNGKCPFGYDDIRGHSGRCSREPGSSKCIPPLFGKICWNERFKKRFCCK